MCSQLHSARRSTDETQVLVEWVLSMQRRIFILREGEAVGETQISVYQIEHCTEPDTEWNGTHKKEVIVKINRLEPL